VLLKIESKFGSQLKPLGHDLRCAVANVYPRINELVAKKQAHPSHYLLQVCWLIYTVLFSWLLWFFTLALNCS